MGCRSYDAQVGHFITRDTYLDQKSYAYCDGDPVNDVDPSEHLPTWKKILATVGGYLGMLIGQGEKINIPPPPTPPGYSQKGGDDSGDDNTSSIIGVGIIVVIVIIAVLAAPGTGGTSLVLLVAA